MSFYEDNVADGSHCMSCCEYIGEDVGYARACRNCAGESEGNSKATKAMRMAMFSRWLAQTGVSHTLHNGGYHVVLSLPDGRKVDVWPSTKKWQLRGGKMSRDGNALNQLVRGLLRKVNAA